MSLTNYNPDERQPNELRVLQQEQRGMDAWRNRRIIKGGERAALKTAVAGAVKLKELQVDLQVTEAEEATKEAKKKIVDAHSLSRAASRTEARSENAHRLQETRDIVKSSALDSDIQEHLLADADAEFIHVAQLLNRDLPRPQAPPETDQ